MIPTDRQTILVVGATGRTGRHVVDGLLEAGATVRALVRNPLTAGLPSDVQLAQGDLDDPASVAAAAAGADAAFLLWHRFDAAGAEAVVGALAEHVGHVAYLSSAQLREGEDGPTPGAWADVEALIEAAPVTHTFVRPGGFAANTLGLRDQVRTGDVVSVPFPQAARSLIHERDIAAVAVRALVDPELTGEAIAITGPQTLTQAEQVAAIGAALGRELEVREQSREAAHRELAQQGGDDWADSSLAHWGSLVERPELTRDGVRRVLGRPPLTFADWARDHADDFRVLPTAEVARRYVAGFRTGDVAAATGLLRHDVVRIAPLEPGSGEAHGLAEILANAEHQTADVELVGVDVGDPLVADDRFAVRFSFDERRRDTGAPQRTTKLSLYDVERGEIVREEVFYLTPAHG